VVRAYVVMDGHLAQVATGGRPTATVRPPVNCDLSVGLRHQLPSRSFRFGTKPRQALDAAWNWSFSVDPSRAPVDASPAVIVINTRSK
jgi:hypothetical protein